MMRFQSIITLVGLVFSSISFQAQNLDWEKKIIGKWTVVEYGEEDLILQKVENFQSKISGWLFLKMEIL